MTTRRMLALLIAIACRDIAAGSVLTNPLRVAIADDVVSQVGGSGTAALVRITVDGENAKYAVIENWTDRRPRLMNAYLAVMAESHKTTAPDGGTFTAVCIVTDRSFSVVPVVDGEVHVRTAWGRLLVHVPLHVYRQLVVEALSN